MMKKTRLIAAAAVAALSASALALTASAYNGYLCFQTAAWSYRNAFDDASSGKDSKYYDGVIMNGGGPLDEGTYADYDDYYFDDLGKGTYCIPAKWTNADIKDAGTYTVSIEDFDWSLDGSGEFNLGYISTDIEYSAGLECTSLTVYIDGESKKTFDAPVQAYSQNKDGNNAGYLQIFFSNPWNDKVGAWTSSYPTKSLKLEFTMAKRAAAETTTESKDSAAAETTTESKDSAAVTGDTQAATTSTKGSPDTGIADVAAIGGLALLAGAGIVVTRKRK